MLVSAASDGASAGQSGARRVEWQDRETGVHRIFQAVTA